MGCDIHIYAEAKINGLWTPIGSVFTSKHYEYESSGDKEKEIVYLGVAEPYEGRNYRLFSILADVRGEGPAIIDCRGFPKDASDFVKKEYDGLGYDAHSAHYYFLNELIENKNRFEICNEFLQTINDLSGLADMYNINYQDVRVVFWFDN